mgnify:FL=1
MLVERQVEILLQAELYYSNGMIDEIRDEQMAKNILWIKEFCSDTTKMVLWAHNEHINKGTSKAGFMGLLEWNNMGYYLRSSIGEGYYALSLEFGTGTILAGSIQRKLQVFEIDNEFAFTKRLSSRDSEALFLDFKNNCSFKDVKVNLHSIGGIYDSNEGNSVEVDLTDYYDGVYFVNEVSPISQFK